MTGTEIADTVRFIANDQAPYKPDDAQMLALLILGLRAVKSLRPDAMLDADDQMRDQTEPTALADELDLDDRFESPLTDYVVMRVFQQKGGDKHWLERAEHHRDTFFKMVKAV